MAPGLLKVMLTQLTREFFQNEHGDVLGQRFHQMKAGIVDKGEHALRDSLVVQRIVDGIRQRGLANIGAELDVHDNGLLDLPFPVENADDGLGLQRVNENFIHATTQIPLSIPDGRKFPIGARAHAQSAAHARRQPHAAGQCNHGAVVRAKFRAREIQLRAESRTTVASRSRKRRFAPTPPATTKR